MPTALEARIARLEANATGIGAVTAPTPIDDLCARFLKETGRTIPEYVGRVSTHPHEFPPEVVSRSRLVRIEE